MRFFDAHTMIGPHFAPYGETFPTAGELLKEMDFFEIEEALVHHGLAREYSIQEGNERLLKEIAGSKRLQPCWVIAPHHSGEMPAARELVFRMLDHGVRTGYLFFGGPLDYAEMPDLTAYEELLSLINSHRIPLLVENTASSVLSGHFLTALDTFLRKFPDIPFILTAAKINPPLIRLLHPRLAEFPNLHIELSGYQWGGAVQDLVTRFGNGRLIYGSRFPWYNLGQTRIHLMYTRISVEDREAIGGGNLKRLRERGG